MGTLQLDMSCRVPISNDTDADGRLHVEPKVNG